ncbi:MAG: hypothetical protein Q7S06_01785 [Nanoarchaeota archaeon]|nr:hypothetical protein [Nanoarchaeota archaeon]
MKKRGASRTKHSKKKYVNTRTLAVVGVAFFLVFAFLLMFVVNNSQLSNSTQVTGAVMTGAVEGDGGLISQMFSGWKEENLDAQLAKILLWATLLMFIASVLNFAGFPPQKFLQFLMALIVSFLAVAYITPDEVITMLASYSALGLALGTIIPFMIILFTSAMLLSNEGKNALKSMTIGKVLLQIVLWVMWGSFLVYRLINLWVIEGFDAILQGGGIVLGVTAVISITILIFNPQFRKWIWRIGNQLREVKEEAISAGAASREKSRVREHKAREESYEGGSGI